MVMIFILQSVLQNDGFVYSILTTIGALLVILAGVLKGYTYIQKMFKEQKEEVSNLIREKLLTLEAEIRLHIDDSEKRFATMQIDLDKVRQENKGIVENYKREFVSVRKDVAEVMKNISGVTEHIKDQLSRDKLEMAAILGGLTTQLAVINTKMELIISRNEEI